MQYLVVLDTIFLDMEIITPREQVSVILHEFGHFVCQPDPYSMRGYTMTPQQQELEVEKMADAYARHCGFGAELKSAISKLRDFKAPRYDSPDIDARLLALDAELVTNLAPILP